MTQRWKQKPPGSNWGEFGPDDQRGRIDMTVEISDVKHLQKVVKALRGIEGVLDVERAAR